jgi:hypothetical protein
VNSHDRTSLCRSDLVFSLIPLSGQQPPQPATGAVTPKSTSSQMLRCTRDGRCGSKAGIVERVPVVSATAGLLQTADGLWLALAMAVTGHRSG